MASPLKLSIAPTFHPHAESSPVILAKVSSPAVAALSAAAYLYLNRKATWLEAALLIGFGWQLQIAHASYHGPIAFALLAVASGLMLARTRQQASGLPAGSTPAV